MSLPIKVRLTVWYITLLSVILAAFGAFLFLRLKTDLIHAVDQSLESRAAQISLGYQGSDQNFQDVNDASLQSLAPGETAAQRLSPVAHDADQVRQARHEVPDAWIDASRVNAYQHLIILNHRLVDVLEL